MELEGVEAFVQVVEAGSFTEAGRRLGVPKSTVSRRIARLEENLGVRLLQRNTRKLALTAAGSAYYSEVGPALSSVKGAGTKVADMQSVPSGTVRITAPLDFASSFLADIACEFTAKYPDIRLDISVSQALVDLISEGFDVAFRGGKLEDSTLVARPLGASDSWLVAAPSYLERHPAPESPEALGEHDLCLFRAASGKDRWALRHDDGTEKSLPVTGKISADDFTFIKSVVAGGGAIGWLPQLLCAQDVARGALVRVLPEWSVPIGHVSLVYPTARYLPRKVQLFRDFVLEWVKNPPWTVSSEPGEA